MIGYERLAQAGTQVYSGRDSWSNSAVPDYRIFASRYLAHANGAFLTYLSNLHSGSDAQVWWTWDQAGVWHDEGWADGRVEEA